MAKRILTLTDEEGTVLDQKYIETNDYPDHRKNIKVEITRSGSIEV